MTESTLVEWSRIHYEGRYFIGEKYVDYEYNLSKVRCEIAIDESDARFLNIFDEDVSRMGM